MAESALWYPYTQMQTMPPPYEVVGAAGARLRLTDGRELVDAIASWWCVIHGYNHPKLNAALARQAGRFSHVMLGGLTHAPARELAARLVGLAPRGLERVFFSDSGSVGVEVALKMALQFWMNRGREEKRRILSLRHAYHGDTAGCMGVCDPEEGMHRLFASLVPAQLTIDAPRGGFRASEADIAEDARALERLFETRGDEIAAFILEPILQAAGGFHFHSPGYLRRARELCDRFDALLIFDEVATGFGRTGRLFAAEHAGVTPDILVLGKGLTAGYLGHAATLATGRVYEAFLGEESGRALMHGPTFMANPLACAVALASLELFEEEGTLASVARIEAGLARGLAPVSGLPHVREVRVLGACGVVEVDAPAAYAGLRDFAAERGVWLRPFGRWVYTMPPYCITDGELGRVTGVLRAWFGAD